MSAATPKQMKRSKFQKTLNRLIPGQLVAPANCSTLAIVQKRIGPNLYLVEWDGKMVEMPRTVLFTYRFGKWISNCDATHLAPLHASDTKF